MAPRAFAGSELDRLRLQNKLLRQENAQLRRTTARIPKLLDRIRALEKSLAEALRAQRRQAAPFSKGPPKEHPRRRGRKSGPDYGKSACRAPPERVDEVIPVPLPKFCICGGRLRYDHTAHQFQVEIFPFLASPGLEPTSHLADQAIRPAVVNRKVFGGNRDPSGARAQEILSSVIATARQRRIPIFDYLSRILRAPPRDRGKVSCQLLRVPLTPP